MFLALRLARPCNSVEMVSREALCKSKPAKLTTVSRLSSPTPTTSFPFSPRAITQVLREEPSSLASATFAVGGWRKNVLATLDGSRRSCTGSMPGAGPVTRISAVTTDAASAIAAPLYRSPAAIARGRKIGTTAATPAHLRSAVTLWSTGWTNGIGGSLQQDR